MRAVADDNILRFQYKLTWNNIDRHILPNDQLRAQYVTYALAILSAAGGDDNTQWAFDNRHADHRKNFVLELYERIQSVKHNNLHFIRLNEILLGIKRTRLPSGMKGLTMTPAKCEWIMHLLL